MTTLGRGAALGCGLAVLALLCYGWLAPGHGGAVVVLAADGAVVLSGDVNYLRLKRAAALYRTGSVNRVLLTGSGVGGDSARTMAGELLKLGVPLEAILTETRSATTHENLLFAAPIIRAHGWGRVALVTSEIHMRRAERVARQVVPEVEWVPVSVPDMGPASRVHKQRVLEWIKLAGYWLRGWA